MAAAAVDVQVVSFPTLAGNDRELVGQLSDVTRHTVFNAIPEATTTTSAHDVRGIAQEMSSVEVLSQSAEFRSDEVEGVRYHDELGPDLIQARSRPLTSFQDAMKLPYNQECLKPLFGPGMSQRAWVSGKFNVELHCTDPWMKKNWRRFRNMCKSGKEGGLKFNLLRRNFMRMLWFERKGIYIDWKTVDVSSRVVPEHRGTNKGVNSTPIGSTGAQQEEENNKKRQRYLSPAPMGHPVPPLTHMTSKVSPPLPSFRGFSKQQGSNAQALSNFAQEDENRIGSILGIRVLQEAGLVIMKQEDLSQLRGNGYRDRQEIARLIAELETEKGMRLATESRRRDDFARMHTEGGHNREEIHRLKREVELLKKKSVAAAAGIELRMDQGLEIHQRREQSCSICQKDMKAFPTMSPGFCKCQFHIHCFWMHIASTEKCNCGTLYPGLLYTYLGRLPQIGAGPGLQNSLAIQLTEQDAATDNGPVKLQKAKSVVRDLLREWHVAGGRNGWHLHNLSDSMKARFDAFHADLQKQAQALGGHKAREIFLSYANKFGLITGNYAMLYPGLDVPDDLVDSPGTGKSNLSNESEAQARGTIHVSDEGEENGEYSPKPNMIIRATSVPLDCDGSEIGDSTIGLFKRHRH